MELRRSVELKFPVDRQAQTPPDVRRIRSVLNLFCKRPGVTRNARSGARATESNANSGVLALVRIDDSSLRESASGACLWTICSPVKSTRIGSRRFNTTVEQTSIQPRSG